MEGKTVLTAYVTGTVTPKDANIAEAFKITIVYSDGSKAVLRKKYDEFVDFQVKVYDLLNQKGGYSRKTARSLISSFPENNSALSRLLYKDSDLKKMRRIDEFIKELLTLPTKVQEADVIKFFFGALHGQIRNIKRSSEEDELKNRIKVAEKIGGRDPLRDLDVLTKEARQLLYQKMNRLNERRPDKKIPTLRGKTRAASVDDGVLDKKTAHPRPRLQRKPFSAPVGMADVFEESEELKKRKPADDGILDKKTAHPRPGLQRRPFSVPVDMADAFKESEELKKRKPADELSKQQSGSDESTATQNSWIDSEHSEVETRSIKVSPQFGAMKSPGRASPVRTKYVVISTFIAEENGEVSLEEGEEVKVLQKETSGWWYVKNDFCEGWAPGTFLEPAVDSRFTSPETADKLDQPDNHDESCPIREKLDSCPKDPDDMEQEKRLVQQEKLKRRGDSGYTSPFRTSPRESSIEVGSESQDESHKENIANSKLYRAMHTYISQDDGEVSFMEGDEVEVIQRSENGWWLVRTSEERGWGPSNFLQSLAY